MKGGSLSDVGTGVGVLCRPGGQGKRVAKIAAFLVESRFRSRLASPGTVHWTGKSCLRDVTAARASL